MNHGAKVKSVAAMNYCRILILIVDTHERTSTLHKHTVGVAQIGISINIHIHTFCVPDIAIAKAPL